MKQILLTAALSVAALGLSAATPAPDAQLVKASDNLKVNSVKHKPVANSHLLAPGITLSSGHGVKKLRVDRPATVQKKQRKATAARAQAPEGFALFESFEGWNGTDYNWTPEGWTVDMRGEVEREYSWTPSMANPYVPAPADGDFYYGINYSTDKQDEWLISPFVQVEPDMNLSYWLFLDPTFLFMMDSEHVDFDKYEFIGEPAVSATLQIWAQEEGGEWTMLRDYFDEYKNYTLIELAYMSPSSLEKNSVNLKDFAGKKTRVAFRYVGTDGNTMFIDAVGIGYPELEDISYVDPWETLYWGFARDWQLSGLNAAIAQYPVFSPLTWSNNSMVDEADFTWTYCDPETADFVTDNDPWELSVTYVPDYSSPATMRNNFFYPPTLTATAPGAAPGSYTAPYVYFQAGGKPERTLNDGSEFEASLLPFSFHNLGVTYTTVDDPTIGDPAIPVFGYNSNVDRYWLDYSLNGNEADAGDYAHLEGIANLFYPPSGAPLVVNGITAYGWGLIDADAELTATIYALNSEMSDEISTFTTLGTAKIKGSDINTEYSDDKGYLCMPFNFAEPVILQASEEHPACFIMIEGFRSEKVQYFAPLQSKFDDPNYLCWGWTLNHIDLSSHTGRGAYYNMRPMTYIEDGDYVDPYCSFAIALNAEYPWLTTETKSIELGDEPAKVELGSYYDGSKLTVEAPAGVTATAAGRYNECVLTVTHSDASVAVDGDITVKGPGVEVVIPVKAAAGITDIITDTNATLVGLYDLNGRRVEAADAATGIYVAKYSDGTARKVAVK